MSNRPLILGVGAALVDMLVEESDAYVATLGSPKGGMTLVEASHIAEALGRATAGVRVVPGGSACNTLVGIGNLGGRARMVGRLGRDALAETFRNGLKKAGVEQRLAESDAATGHVLSVVTPDTQRTMFTFLGAAAQLHPDDVIDEDFHEAALVHLEGYLLFNRPVVEKTIDLARKHGAKVTLDLASFQVVEVMRGFIEELFGRNQIDIVIANEDEARAYSGMGESESLEMLIQKVPMAVVKRGAEGVLIAQGKQRLDVEAHRVKALDTTGAGDLWASGFLFGLNHGLDLEASARLGCKVGSEVVQVLGAVIPDAGWQRVFAYRDALPKL